VKQGTVPAPVMEDSTPDDRRPWIARALPVALTSRDWRECRTATETVTLDRHVVSTVAVTNAAAAYAFPLSEEIRVCRLDRWR
jgi:hypothetical protein